MCPSYTKISFQVFLDELVGNRIAVWVQSLTSGPMCRRCVCREARSGRSGGRLDAGSGTAGEAVYTFGMRRRYTGGILRSNGLRWIGTSGFRGPVL